MAMNNTASALATYTLMFYLLPSFNTKIKILIISIRGSSEYLSSFTLDAGESTFESPTAQPFSSITSTPIRRIAGIPATSMHAN